MRREELRGRLCLSGIDDEAASLAGELGLGFEITAFCQASQLEDRPTIELARRQAERNNYLWLHAPFAELHPCAIDPLVRDIARRRYRETIAMARQLGVHRVVIHDGFVPMVYFPEWFTEQSIIFWSELIREVPRDMVIALENVMDDRPDHLGQILSAVDDHRLQCCLDIGHANTRISHVPPLSWVEPLAPWLCHVHLHNNEGDWDLHNPLGEGSIPVEQILDTILEKCPRADFTLENMQCRPSLEWLTEKGYL